MEISIIILQIVSIIGLLFIVKALIVLEKRLSNLEEFISNYFRNDTQEEKSVGGKLMNGMENIKLDDNKRLNMIYMTNQFKNQIPSLTPKEKEILQVS